MDAMNLIEGQKMTMIMMMVIIIMKPIGLLDFFLLSQLYLKYLDDETGVKYTSFKSK